MRKHCGNGKNSVNVAQKKGAMLPSSAASSTGKAGSLCFYLHIAGITNCDVMTHEPAASVVVPVCKRSKPCHCGFLCFILCLYLMCDDLIQPVMLIDLKMTQCHHHRQHLGFLPVGALPVQRSVGQVLPLRCSLLCCVPPLCSMVLKVSAGIGVLRFGHSSASAFLPWIAASTWTDLASCRCLNVETVKYSRVKISFHRRSNIRHQAWLRGGNCNSPSSTTDGLGCKSSTKTPTLTMGSR